MKQPPVLERLTKNIPTLITAILLAIAVWILAVTSTDPVQQRSFGRMVEIEFVGLDPSYIITNEVPEEVTLTLSAPTSVWSSDLTSSNAVRAIADLSGIETGEHIIPINLQIDARPVKIESYTPDQIDVVIEKLVTKSFDIELQQLSFPAVGYDAGVPVLSNSTASVTGPSSITDQVTGVRASLNVNQASENIDVNLNLSAVDEEGRIVSGVTISPSTINVKLEISQRGGYRNLPVKVVTTGQPASGYNLTNITNDPLIITVFASDSNLVDELPGFIETIPLNLEGAMEDMVVSLPLNIPTGITVVGDAAVKVTVSIESIQGSRTLADIPIEIRNLTNGLETAFAPDTVDIILNGPQATLDKLVVENVVAYIDLTNFEAGTYQLSPSAEINVDGVVVQSILPSTIEIQIGAAGSLAE